MYEGEPLESKDQFAALMSKTRNHKQNVNGLVYDASQAPKRNDVKGWKNVIWAPNSDSPHQFHHNSLFEIETENDGHILVQFLQKDRIDTTIREGVDYFLNNHSNVRETKFEDGIMVGAGLRYEARRAMLCRYTNTKNASYDPVLAAKIERECFLAFNNLIRNPEAPSVFRNDHKATIDELDSVNNTLRMPTKKGAYSLLPTYAVSESLNNSLHVDFNDASRCYAVFYQKEKKIGKSFLVFPKYSLAIECSTFPVLISWDGSRQQHCTMTVEKGIPSLFGGSNRIVGNFTQGLYNFANPPKQEERAIKEGDVVNIQLHRTRDHLVLYDNAYSTKKYMDCEYVVRTAKVEKVEGDFVDFTYIGKLASLGLVRVPKSLVLPKSKCT